MSWASPTVERVVLEVIPSLRSLDLRCTKPDAGTASLTSYKMPPCSADAWDNTPSSVLPILNYRPAYCLRQASETSMAFYAKAKKNIWLQAFGLCIVVGAEMVLGIVNGVNVAGQHASVTLWYMQVKASGCGHVRLVVSQTVSASCRRHGYL